MTKCVGERSAKAVVADDRFAHVMALTLDPMSRYDRGLIRCVMSRAGDVIKNEGYIDKSELHHVRHVESGSYQIGDRVMMIDEDKMMSMLLKEYGHGWQCIGFEDPDIFVDEGTGLTHVYFTIPLHYVGTKKMQWWLGHAEGVSLDTLHMTEPVLFRHHSKIVAKATDLAKEVSIAPLNHDGMRYNLFESSDIRNKEWYSVIRVACARDLGLPWEYRDIAFHPAEGDIWWAAEHASPGPLVSREFLDVGDGRLLGFMNGRGKSTVAKNGSQVYGRFSVGLFIYNYEIGKIEWVSPDPLIFDSEARTITFASMFVETVPGKGVLYAHVDDSFVRAYDLDAEVLRKLIPEEMI